MFGVNGGSEASFDIGVAVFGTVLPILNSALNPVIIISRSKDLREEFVRRMRRVKRNTAEVSLNRDSMTTEQSEITVTRIVD